MEDIKDWCISRQIWWGHRIPVWYCQKMQNEECRRRSGIIVSRTDPEKCPECGAQGLIQDEDVLDTWFSSALWPFSTLGWPENTDDLRTFYPTSVLVTAFDILFFWVARMIMMGNKFMGDVPFRDVYIHALIRDMKGQKMSKSKGNVVDPLIMIDRYGTDAFRFTLAAFAAQGRDIKFSEERVEGYRHFVNKLWNAARFILMNTEDFKPDDSRTFSLPSRWIMSRMAVTVEEMSTALKEYRFNDAAGSIYQFMWHEFCDWYIEMAKIEFQDPRLAKTSQWCLLSLLDISLRLLHPFMPFITEEIWQKFKAPGLQSLQGNAEMQESIMTSEYPGSLPREPEAENDMSFILDAVLGIRTIRGELNIPPSTKISVFIKPYTEKAERILKDNLNYVKTLAKAETIKTGLAVLKPEGSATSHKNSMEIFVPLKGILNITAELDRLKKEKIKLEAGIASLNKKLFNDDFIQKAPKDIIEKEKAKYEDLVHMKDRIMESMKMLKEAEVSNDG
jgi:valyl-tRNA synthetase